MTSSIKRLLKSVDEGYGNVCSWISNVRHGTHKLRTNVKLGTWQDMDERVFNATFEALVDFVEIELASWERKHKWYHTRLYTAIFTERSPELGLKHLAWEVTCDNSDWIKEGEELKLTPQAYAAMDKRDLYLWWKARPNRIDGFTKAGEYDPTVTKEMLAELLRKLPQEPTDMLLYAKIPMGETYKGDFSEFGLDKLRALMIGAYEAEDSLMFKRLINVLGSCWT